LYNDGFNFNGIAALHFVPLAMTLHSNTYMNTISAIIVAKDNPPHLFESIESITDFVAEIIVIDVGISLEVKEKLETYQQLRIIHIAHDVPYVELIRQESFQYAHHPYILLLDHDEVIPSTLKGFLKNIYTQYDYIAIPRKNLIFNQWIQHSRWWPDYQIRFFKKGKVTWPKELHAQPKMEGSGLTIDPQEEYAIIHYNYESIDEYMSKMVRYARSEAKEITESGKKYSLSDAVQKSLNEFVSRFFAHQGYKDGVHGFILAFLQMFYYFLVYLYVWEKHKYAPVPQKEILQESRHFFAKGLFETQHWMVKLKLLDGKKGWMYRVVNKVMRLVG
jgi:(heptosyl)LPS beta-1,4-glucosyltransferase